jgi:starvation-inducible DNA-binding protein
MKIHKTKNSLSLDKRKASIDLLQQCLVSSIDLSTMSKQAHWNVKGETFISLHELFDRLHGSVANFSDKVAERLTSLGGSTKATTQSVAKQSALTQYPEDIFQGKEHLEHLTTAIADLGGFVRDAIDKTITIGDLGTSDLFTEYSRELDHFLWLLEAHLQ